MDISIGAADDKGGHGHQEDANESRRVQDGADLFIADGMHSRPRGEKASAAAVASIRTRTDGMAVTVQLVRAAMAAADDAVTAVGEDGELSDSRRKGPGSTLTAVFIRGTRMTVGHIGDTRLYLLRGEKLMRLSRDHDSKRHLRRALGNWDRKDRKRDDWQKVPGQRRSPYDVWQTQVQPGDVLLMTSDGVHDVLPDGRIHNILAAALRSKLNPSQAAEKVMRAALPDASDNVTAVVAYLR